MTEKIKEKYGDFQTKHYGVLIQSDGKFRAEDILPGEYVFRTQIYAKKADGRRDHTKLIGKIEHEFTVPELTQADEDTPLDIGVISFDKANQLGVGQPAPEFEVDGLEGGKLKLSDYKGKVVLINFWSVHMLAGGDDGIENIKRIYEQFGGDKRFDILGLTFGGIKYYNDLSKKYIEEKNIKWKLGVVGFSNFNSGIIKDYGLKQWPFNILIDAEGKVIAIGLKGEELENAVAQALKE